uniref:Uncharacterized protein n=1 Tax=Rhizophora mucronata TaxID=61149 RepID=A0A2P2PAG7_RHIMU
MNYEIPVNSVYVCHTILPNILVCLLISP